jgi:ribonuclease III
MRRENNNFKTVNFGKFEELIGVSFKDTFLLRQAFTHRSFINENRHLNTEHNERLEFLGDAVLELVVTRFLFDKFPDKPEGELTSYRAALVNTNTIADAAGRLAMNDFLLLSKGESKDTGRARQYILADTFEAFIGALYLDQGYEAAREFIAENIFQRIDEVVANRLWQDHKSHFQELSQDHVGITPTYRLLEEKGPDHDKHFIVGVYLGSEKVSVGEGKSKQEAEQEAASEALSAKGWK